jgi:hypothetical protein
VLRLTVEPSASCASRANLVRRLETWCCTWGRKKHRIRATSRHARVPLLPCKQGKAIRLTVRCPLWVISGHSAPQLLQCPLPPIADIDRPSRIVRFVPKADSAKSHSMTSSARMSTFTGIVRPRSAAAFSPLDLIEGSVTPSAGRCFPRPRGRGQHACNELWPLGGRKVVGLRILVGCCR